VLAFTAGDFIAAELGGLAARAEACTPVEKYKARLAADTTAAAKNATLNLFFDSLAVTNFLTALAARLTEPPTDTG
jgi:hypothetical protein